MQGSGSNTSGPSFCVTCPNRLSGVCGTILGPRDAAGKQTDKAPRFFPVRAGGQIAGRSQAIRDVFVLCAGWAFRFVQLSDGRRQIVQFLLREYKPGTESDAKMLHEHRPGFTSEITLTLDGGLDITNNDYAKKKSAKPFKVKALEFWVFFKRQ